MGAPVPHDITAEIEDKRDQLEALCQEYEVNRLELFGSATTGEFAPETSDLDFLVEFRRPPVKHSLSDQFFGLYYALQDLFGRRVDLLETHLLTNRYLANEVNKQRRLIYVA
jgi:uncharacterized protein